jgi:hypothetical protein
MTKIKLPPPTYFILRPNGKLSRPFKTAEAAEATARDLALEDPGHDYRVLRVTNTFNIPKSSAIR